MAVKPNVTIDSVSTDIASGGTTNLKYTVTNNNPLASGQSSVQVQVSGISCTSGDCGAVVTIPPQTNVQRSATLTAPQVAAGQTKVVNLQITATINGDTFTASQQLNVHGADKPKTVHQIVGVVKDGKGNAISGANVGMKDSAGTSFGTTSNGNGGYVFTTSDSKPIAVGGIVVGAAKEGYKTVTVTVQGGADKTVNVPLTLQSLVASPSASPSASASASAEPSDQATDDPTATDAPSVPPADAAKTANNSSSGSTLFIILGGLLVAAGIGAIVLVLMRRKNSGDPDDPDDPNGPSGPNGVVPPSQGRFNGVDPTRVGAPVGGRANDATMVANMAGQPSISDAPTMLQRAVPVEDEFPDPYGAPAVTPGNYAGPGGWGTTSAAAAAAGTYGAAQPGGTYGGGYGADNQYGGAAPAPAPAAGYDDGGYGAPHPYARAENEEAYGAYGAGQYGGGAAEQQRFDEPTGMYRPEPQGDHRQDQGGYDQGGYDQGQSAGYDQGGQPGYGQAGYDQGGYRQEPEYPPASGRGAYQPQPGGYSGGGYGGGQEPADDQGGYGSWGNSPGGGIDSGNAYGPPAGGGGAGYGQGGGYGGPASGGPAGGGPGGGASGYGADQGGYDPRATYGQPDGGYEQGGGRRQQGGGGYGADQGQGGYYAGEQQDGGGGRHGAQSRQQPPPPESTHPGQRRPLDWLDD